MAHAFTGDASALHVTWQEIECSKFAPAYGQPNISSREKSRLLSARVPAEYAHSKLGRDDNNAEISAYTTIMALFVLRCATRGASFVNSRVWSIPASPSWIAISS